MKTAILSLILFFIAMFSLKAQSKLTLMTFESYTFPTKFTTSYGKGRIGDGFQWGGGLEYAMNNLTAYELIYQRLTTTANYQGLDYNNQLTYYTGGVGVNYIMLGATRYQPINNKISGFGTTNIGVGWINPEQTLASQTTTKFSIGARAGIRIEVNPKVNIRLHGQFISPVQWFGGGFYFGSNGPGTSVTTGSTIWQFNLGGSLNYVISDFSSSKPKNTW